MERPACASNHRVTVPAKKPILGLSMTWSGITPRAAFFRRYFVVRPRILRSAGILAASSTNSWSRNGTRTSSECAIEVRSK